MTCDQLPSPALLPPGFIDLLAADAQTEANGTQALLSVFASHGYERVAPPLLEFEDTLLGGAGAALADQAFRLMDPDTRRMMALRPDITPQIARIAATRLHDAPRPLRLSYAGQAVLVGNGTAGQNERQIGQAGIELIGPDSAQADAEVVAIAAEALARVGITDLSFDLTMPLLAPSLIEQAGLPAATVTALMHALDRKDAAAVAEHGGPIADVLIRLLNAAGEADQALAALQEVDLPEKTRAFSDRLRDSTAAIRARVPGCQVTVDPVEFRGWKYHTGVCVSVYALGSSEELGRGGRYLCNDDEPACGLTLRPNAVFRVAPRRAQPQRVYLPFGTDEAVGRTLRDKGHVTVAGLAPAGSEEEEARRLACSFVSRDGTLVPVN
ncbi:histidyl-tRNA synthetase [Acetobacter aceti NRIC 0242]|uniref:ATP phosphoribosyltransferase regulatory subunit n=1 Tax=Acetobacter aceti NBRC 14818 TaxID=887700 RepID=A0AB33IFG7_ACEAC|nr:ATP phosphoribosyltransferase regulatory subunit [Acetobacter aceti]TCS33142.1 ATP phosphoribosyltransferase regulatory subunit [Acetobacter aceti NBRC 14818]BCK75800.1 ATP phosphoribosyltransferase regulatory subunit [Acetobacter aceti NBRC 14818]GAN57979.1 histidyl-tRNA synthetase [Acetobacter aceti NBRC 14818]GBO80626.1 histidyl-tRNA synthetase [Acetobacter aceti NRIC 0242]